MSDNYKLHYANGIADRIQRDEAVMAQLRSYKESQIMHGISPEQVRGAVLDIMNDNEKLSMPLLRDADTGRPVCFIDP